MSKTLESFFLGDLIKDIEEKNNNLKKKIPFENFKENFNKANLENSNSNNSNETLNTSIQMILTKEEIFFALSKQKTGIFLQKTIKEMNNIEISNIIQELKDSFSKLMKDKNGNYFCSDLFKLCSINQRLIIIKEIINDFINLSINQFGTHPIQILIELIESNEEIEIFSKVFNNLEQFLKLCFNSNGSYVIQKLITYIPENKRIFINNLFLNSIHILSCNMYGVVCLKKFVFFSKSDFVYNEIIINLISNFVKISEDQFGNYFVQYILDLWWERKEMMNIKNLIIFYFCRFSQNKFASHICEIYINHINLNEKQILLSYFINKGIYNILLKDNYGVFVINKLIKSCMLNYSLN